MSNYRMTPMLRVMACLLATALAASYLGTLASRASNDEQTLWNLEHAYWRYVENNDLPSYRGLWHQNFLGWPRVSAEPVHKDHITDWMTSETGKGLAFKLVELKPAGMQVTGDIAVTYYRLTFRWLDKGGAGEAHTSRITHTWIKNGKDWQILGGMSAAEPAIPRK